MTLRFAILGDPVAHSLSPAIQNAGFAYAGVDARYERRRVDEAGFLRAVEDLRAGRLAGANVTMPHKRLAARLADEIRGEGALMGAANTLWAEDGKLLAASTDPAGVHFAWAYAGLSEVAPVHILGAGGAAVAAVVALRGRALWVSARREDKAREMVVALESDASVIPWGTPIPDSVLVNATPLGMSGERLPLSVVASSTGLLEMTYGTRPSPAAVDMTERSLPVATGELMLVGQGIASFHLWTGIDIPHSVMIEALATAQSGR